MAGEESLGERRKKRELSSSRPVKKGELRCCVTQEDRYEGRAEPASDGSRVNLI